jgi:RNA polymerase sigma-70 factor (ECF subfamily)
MAAGRLGRRGTTGASETARAGAALDWELAHVERARRDPAAFAPLYEAYVDLVWRYALSRLGDVDRAGDATSQTFTKAITALPRFEPQRGTGGSAFRAWLMTIARNVVIDEMRRERNHVALDAPAAEPWLIDESPSPESSAADAAERQRIEQALTQLPATQRQIVELRAIGMKGHEIAALLNMSIPAVKTANHRAYAQLRMLLGDSEHDQDTRP